MAYVIRSGAGLSIRSDEVNLDRVGAAVTRILACKEYRHAARRIAREFGQYECGARFQGWLDNLFLS
jgi:UDP:flavonoid glycosyltransferase YjiC (YdhE family)